MTEFYEFYNTAGELVRKPRSDCSPRSEYVRLTAVFDPRYGLLRDFRCEDAPEQAEETNWAPGPEVPLTSLVDQEGKPLEAPILYRYARYNGNKTAICYLEGEERERFETEKTLFWKLEHARQDRGRGQYSKLAGRWQIARTWVKAFQPNWLAGIWTWGPGWWIKVRTIRDYNTRNYAALLRGLLDEVEEAAA